MARRIVKGSLESSKRGNAALKERCDVLVGIIEGASLQYARLSRGQKDYLETIIGAAVFYLPTPIELWTGKVSVGLLKSYHPDSGVTKPKQPTKDHEYPRKIAAAELLSKVRWHELTDKTTRLMTEYRTRFGRYHYMTSKENHTLKWLLKNDGFTTPQDGYDKAKIVLVAVSREEWLAIKKRDRTVIERCLERA
jgi:hypothetical protein